MISLLSKFRSPRAINSWASRDSKHGRYRREAIIHHATQPKATSIASCGEGELLKKRTERGYLTGSGIKTSRLICDGMAPAFMGFLNSIGYGGKGAYAQEFTSVHRFEMSRNKHLGWSWKPDIQTVCADRKRAVQRHKRRCKKKKKITLSRREKLLHAPGYIFYESKQWQRLRLEVLARYGRRCMFCGCTGVEMHVDHIQPRSRAPLLSLSFDNLHVLCRDCNKAKSNIHAEDYREQAVADELDRKHLAETNHIFKDKR